MISCSEDGRPARASIGRDLCFNLGLVCIRTSTLMSSVISAADLPGDAPIGTGMVRAGAAAVWAGLERRGGGDRIGATRHLGSAERHRARGAGNGEGASGQLSMPPGVWLRAGALPEGDASPGVGSESTQLGR